jgi:hypothetical protein
MVETEVIAYKDKVGGCFMDGKNIIVPIALFFLAIIIVFAIIPILQQMVV